MRSGGQAGGWEGRNGKSNNYQRANRDRMISGSGVLPRARAWLIWMERAWLVAVQPKKRTPRAWLDIKWQLM